jgi:hypothetical protein
MRTQPYDLPILDYLAPIVQVYVSLKAHPLTAPLAADIAPLQDEWKAVLVKEVDLEEKVAEADALVLLADFELDALFLAIVNALLTLVHNDRTHVHYTRFLGNDRPSDVRDPILGEELERLRSWPPGLATVPSDEVKKQGAALATFVPKADAAVEAQRKATQELTDFTELGARKTLVDHLNATSKLVYGKLSELMHTPAGQVLPPDFLERCFPPESRVRHPTIKGEERIIERLEKNLVRHKAALEKLKKKKEESEAARKAAEKTARKNEADKLKKEAEELLAKAAELEEEPDA